MKYIWKSAIGLCELPPVEFPQQVYEDIPLTELMPLDKFLRNRDGLLKTSAFRLPARLVVDDGKNCAVIVQSSKSIVSAGPTLNTLSRIDRMAGDFIEDLQGISDTKGVALRIYASPKPLTSVELFYISSMICGYKEERLDGSQRLDLFGMNLEAAQACRDCMRDELCSAVYGALDEETKDCVTGVSLLRWNATSEFSGGSVYPKISICTLFNLRAELAGAGMSVVGSGIDFTFDPSRSPWLCRIDPSNSTFHQYLAMRDAVCAWAARRFTVASQYEIARTHLKQCARKLRGF